MGVGVYYINISDVSIRSPHVAADSVYLLR